MKTPWWKDLIWYITGSVLYALSVSVFSTPNDIAPGGAAGLGVIAHTLLGVPVGTVVLLLNVPLLIAAFFKISRRFAVRTAVVTVLSSVIIDLSAYVAVPFTEDRLLAALFGGILSGVGIGVIMLRAASTGGSEIAARLLKLARPHIAVGRLILLVDAAVIALSSLVFSQLSAALYAAVQVTVSSLMIDHILDSHEEGRLLIVVTAHPDSLCREVTERMSRGATVLAAKGGYTGKALSVLLCAVSRSQLPSLRRLVHEVDPAAFAMIVTTEQVVGEGFLLPQNDKLL